MSFDDARLSAVAAQDGGSSDDTELNNNSFLLDLLHDEKWNDILKYLRQQQQQQQQERGVESSTTNEQVFSLREQVARVWSNACSIKSYLVPIEFVRDLFGLLRSTDDGNDDNSVLAIHQDFFARQTALHMAVLHCANRPDIIQVLLTTFRAGNIQNIVDVEGLRPIDILTQRILMKEERLRYSSKRGRQQTSTTAGSNTDLDDCWESARLLAISHVAGGGVLQQGQDCFPTRAQLPLLHACCLAADTLPRSLLERAMRRCPPNEFMLRADAIHGNTPLHCVAVSATFRRRPNPAVAAVVVEAQQQPQDEDDLETVDDSNISNNANNDDLLAEVLRREPRAASIVNHNHAYPLALAISEGRTWKSSDCRVLLEAHPAAILHVLPSETNNISKRLLAEIFSKGNPATGTTAADFDFTYSILHVIQPQALFA